MRKCKNRQKLIGGFRTYNGLALFADLLLVVETAKRRNQSVFETLIGVAETSVMGLVS